MLAHAVVHIAPAIVGRIEGRRALDVGIVRAGQVSRAADHLRDGRDQGRQGRARHCAGGVRDRLFDQAGDMGVQLVEGVGRQVAGHGALEIGAGGGGLQRRFPGLARLAAPAAGGAPGLEHLVGHGEGLGGPGHGRARGGDLRIE